MTDIELKTLKDNLWHSADMLRAGAHLAANKYGQPILGLIFQIEINEFFESIKETEKGTIIAQFNPFVQSQA